ncbi:hypothetical protein QUC31_009760, partial [Theobroma cacao]
MATNNQRTAQEIVINPAPLDVDPLVPAAMGDVSDESAGEPFAPAVTPSEEERTRFNYYRPLHLAALKGNWEAAKGYFPDGDSEAFTEDVSCKGMNALLVASCNGQTKFVEMLVQRMPEKALEKRGPGGYTALHHAAIGGHLKMAKALIRKNPILTQITDNDGKTPLLCAVLLFSRHKLVRYLASKTTNEKPERPFSGCKGGDLMVNLTHMGFHVCDEDDPLETSDQDLGVEKQSQSNEAKTQVPCINKVTDKKLGHERACKLVHLCLEALLDYNERKRNEYFDKQKILHFAARCGVVEIVTASLHYFPDLIFSEHGSLILKNAIQCRQEKVFNLACKKTSLDKMFATMCYEPSISHLAAKLPIKRRLSDDSYAASQMQREMQWYK